VTKSKYLALDVVSEFVSYFTKLCCDKSSVFAQRFEYDDGSGEFYIDHFQDALVNYYWRSSDFYSLAIKSSFLIDDIEHALDFGHNTKALKASLRILGWHKLFDEHDVGWLLDSHDCGALADRLNQAVQLLTGDNEQGLDLFNTEKLLSSQAISCLYGHATNDRTVILNQQVADAIQMIVHSFVKHGFVEHSDYHTTPEQLCFTAHSGQPHALANLRLNWIITEVVQHWQTPLRGAVSSKLKEIESCLFMIGQNTSAVSKIAVPTVNGTL
jgi:hypothetical protein